MHTYVIGAGAMGGIYGGLLAKAGYEVTLIDIRQDHVGQVQRDGLVVEGVRGRHVVPVAAQTDIAGLPPGDFAIIFTDANSTKEAARTTAQILKPDGFALTLQNGIGNVEALIEALGAARVVAGV